MKTLVFIFFLCLSSVSSNSETNYTSYVYIPIGDYNATHFNATIKSENEDKMWILLYIQRTLDQDFGG